MLSPAVFKQRTRFACARFGSAEFFSKNSEEFARVTSDTGSIAPAVKSRRFAQVPELPSTDPVQNSPRVKTSLFPREFLAYDEFTPP